MIILYHCGKVVDSNGRIEKDPLISQILLKPEKCIADLELTQVIFLVSLYYIEKLLLLMDNYPERAVLVMKSGKCFTHLVFSSHYSGYLHFKFPKTCSFYVFIDLCTVTACYAQ